MNNYLKINNNKVGLKNIKGDCIIGEFNHIENHL